MCTASRQRKRKIIDVEIYHTDPQIEGVHTTHSLYLVKDVVFCIHCGYWMQQKVEKLRNPCGREPPNAEYKRVLKRLLFGWHPRQEKEFWPDGTPAQSYSDVIKYIPREPMKKFKGRPPDRK